jgi:CspA family cold shock protein
LHTAGHTFIIDLVRDFAVLVICPHAGFSKNTPNPDRTHRNRCGGSGRNSVFEEVLMAIGTVKFFNGQRGFGFIAPDGGGADVFVHISAVERAGMRGLAEGQKVSYEVEADRKTGKSAAINLQNA